MGDLAIHPSTLSGQITIPSSKSHTLRAILFAALAKGTSTIENPLTSPDTTAMIEAVTLFGAKITHTPNALQITGFAGKPSPASDVIQCGNSGLVLRLIGALSGLIPRYTILTGDASIRNNRPVKPLLDGLTQLGAFATSSLGNDQAPILIKGPLTKTTATLSGADSQPVSGLLIASAFAPHPIQLIVTDPKEKPWIDLTLDWFKRLGIPCIMENYTHYSLQGSAQINAFHHTVPGDFSTAAFPIAAALLTNSEITLNNLDFTDVQGDKILLSLLEQMGAHFSYTNRTLTIHKNSSLKGISIDLDTCIDALPILAVIACFASTPTTLFNGAIARKKESDRIFCITNELKKMGAKIEEKTDGLIVYPSPLHGAKLHSHFDHRLAMSLSVAALGAKTPSLISDTECIAKTYANFRTDFQNLGAKIDGL